MKSPIEWDVVEGVGGGERELVWPFDSGSELHVDGVWFTIEEIGERWTVAVADDLGKWKPQGEFLKRADAELYVRGRFFWWEES